MSATSCETLINAPWIASRFASGHIAVSSEQLGDVCTGDELTGEMRVQRRQCHRPVADDLHGDALLTEQEDGSENRIANDADPLQHRFALVFDREGYSPDFLQRMKAQRIACLTYHKFPGEVLTMELAERGTCLRNGLWVRELRKRTARGHQTAILCTDYRSAAAPLAMAVFTRWSQENYFKYARENFSLDRLVDYRTAAISDP